MALLVRGVELRRLRELLVCVDVRDTKRSPSEDFVLRTPVRDLCALVLALALLRRRFVLVAVLFVVLMIGSTTSFVFVDVVTVTAVPADRRRRDFRLTGVFLPEDGP